MNSQDQFHIRLVTYVTSRLILSYNVLEGDIPPTLGKLRRLNALGLDNNHLVGRIPAETATLPSLRMAAFYANIDLCWMFKPTQPKFRADYHHHRLCQLM